MNASQYLAVAMWIMLMKVSASWSYHVAIARVVFSRPNMRSVPLSYLYVRS